MNKSFDRQKFELIFRSKRFDVENHQSKELKELVEELARQNIKGSFANNSRNELIKNHFKEILNVWTEAMIESFKRKKISKDDENKIKDLFKEFAEFCIEFEKNRFRTTLISSGLTDGSALVIDNVKALEHNLQSIKYNLNDRFTLAIEKHNDDLSNSENFEKQQEPASIIMNNKFSNIWEKYGRPTMIAVIAGLIVLIFTIIYNSYSQNGNDENRFADSNKIFTRVDTSKFSINEPISSKLNKKYVEVFLQTQDVQSIFDDTLTIAYTSFMEVSNQKAEFKLSKVGVDSILIAKLSIGEKVFFHEYEILFYDAKLNLSIYDVMLRVYKVQ